MAGVFYFPLLGTPTAEGNQLWFYEAGLDVPLDVWTDSDLSIPWAQPIVLNAAGESDGPIYVSDSPSYKVVYKDSNGVPIPGYPVDFVAPSTIINVTTVSTTTLTNAQIKALPTTPISLVAAPAAGLIIQPLSVLLSTHTTAGAYTNINAAGVLSVEWVGGLPAFGYVPNDTLITNGSATRLTQLLGSTTPKYAHLLPFADTSDVDDWGPVATIVDTSAVSGVGLELTIDNAGSGALTGGNSANTLTVTVFYALQSAA